VQAVHPGYGFLSENDKFADAVEQAGLVWIGPPQAAMAQMGDKLRARQVAQQANVPLVPGVDPPQELFALDTETGPVIIGLTKTPERLIQLRKNRLRQLSQEDDTDYVHPETVREEVANARRLFTKNNWPVVDVTRRSIEETAAAILQRYEQIRGDDA